MVSHLIQILKRIKKEKLYFITNIVSFFRFVNLITQNMDQFKYKKWVNLNKYMCKLDKEMCDESAKIITNKSIIWRNKLL